MRKRCVGGAVAAWGIMTMIAACATPSERDAVDDAGEITAPELAVDEDDPNPSHEDDDGAVDESDMLTPGDEGADEGDFIEPELASDGSESQDANLEDMAEELLPAAAAAASVEVYIGVVEQKTNRIMVFPSSDGTWSDRKPNWSWGANNSPQIPVSARARFNNPSGLKLKTYGKETRVLVAASGGGVAIIRPSDRKATFVAYPGGNPHAIEALPGSYVVTASSHGLTASSKGFLCVFSTKAGASKSCARTEFPKAHGVVWDGARQRLWALGGTRLGSYTFSGGRLKADKAWKVPGNGHDLTPDGKDRLLFSSTHNVYSFDRNTHKYQSIAKINPRNYIKGIDRHPVTNELVIARDPDLSDKVYGDDLVYRYTAAGARQISTRKGAQFYKARWWVAR